MYGHIKRYIRLALVGVDLDDPARDDVRYRQRPFADEKVSALVSTVQFKWHDMRDRGGPPS
jgi:hypothetical protein